MKLSRFLIVWLVFSAGLAFSQDEKTVSPVFTDDILFTEVNPLHPFGIFTLDRPFYMGTFNKKGSKFSVGYSMGNTWHPQTTMYYPQSMTPYQKAETNNLYMTQRPYYFYLEDIPYKTKTFSSDGVLQNLSFTYLWQLGKQGSFLFKLNTHWLSGGTAAVHHLASDDFIEWFHDQVGLHDNFGRYQYIFNLAHINFQDEEGRSLRVDKGDFFPGTFDIHYYRPLWRVARRASYNSFQIGAHLGIPLNNRYTEIAGGLSGTFLYRKRIFPKFYTDLGFDFALMRHELAGWGNNPSIIDIDYRKTGKTYLSFNFVSKKNRVFYFGLMNDYQDPFLKGYIFSKNQDKYRDLGVYFLQPGDVWEGYEVKEYFHHAKLTAASMYFFSIKSYIFMGFKAARGDFSFNVGEDYLSVNNAPDIQYGFRYTRSLNW